MSVSWTSETVDAWEIGTKGVLLDIVQLNVAVFWNEPDDFQLNSFNGLNFVVDNIGGVTSKGIEIEAQARPLDQPHWPAALPMRIRAMTMTSRMMARVATRISATSD